MRLGTYYFVEDDCYGQHGTFIEEIKLSAKDFRLYKATRTYKGRFGFLTKDYLVALMYTQD